jgi:hypothetical protein
MSRVLLLFALVASAGCCTAPPDGEKYFDRARSPGEAVRLFRYSVEAKQYDVAYRCFTERFRERHSAREVSLAFRFGSYEGHGLRRIIVEALQDERVERVDGTSPEEASWVTLVYFVDPEDDSSNFEELSLFVRREGGEWRIDPDIQRQEQQAIDFSRAPGRSP